MMGTPAQSERYANAALGKTFQFPEGELPVTKKSRLGFQLGDYTVDGKAGRSHKFGQSRSFG